MFAINDQSLESNTGRQAGQGHVPIATRLQVIRFNRWNRASLRAITSNIHKCRLQPPLWFNPRDSLSQVGICSSTKKHCHTEHPTAQRTLTSREWKDLMEAESLLPIQPESRLPIRPSIVGPGEKILEPLSPLLKVHVALAVWWMSCTCVPSILAAGPRNLSTKRWEQVEEGPCLDDNVWDGSVSNHNLGSVTDPWEERQHLITVYFLIL